jgi:two-component system response regulator FixJ
MPPVPAKAKDAVLVIDDDSDVLASLKFALEVDGFSVEVFRSAEELLARPLPAGPACLVVDYRLPGMDGIELVSSLRARGMETPALLITTDPPPHVRQRSAEAGLAIVEKPLLGNALAEAIRSVVKG